MKFLLDTDTCVWALRGRASVRNHLTEAGPEETAISVVALAELRYGANCSAKPQGNHQAIDDFTSGVAVLGVDIEVARVFGEIKAQLRQAGKLIEDLDLMIAATACVYDLTLVTSNAGHFDRIPGLRLENWVE